MSTEFKKFVSVVTVPDTEEVYFEPLYLKLDTIGGMFENFFDEFSTVICRHELFSVKGFENSEDYPKFSKKAPVDVAESDGEFAKIHESTLYFNPLAVDSVQNSEKMGGVFFSIHREVFFTKKFSTSEEFMEYLSA